MLMDVAISVLLFYFVLCFQRFQVPLFGGFVFGDPFGDFWIALCIPYLSFFPLNSHFSLLTLLAFLPSIFCSWLHVQSCQHSYASSNVAFISVMFVFFFCIFPPSCSYFISWTYFPWFLPFLFWESFYIKTIISYFQFTTKCLGMIFIDS